MIFGRLEVAISVVPTVTLRGADVLEGVVSGVVMSRGRGMGGGGGVNGLPLHLASRARPGRRAGG